jgi:hypothetical protein
VTEKIYTILEGNFPEIDNFGDGRRCVDDIKTSRIIVDVRSVDWTYLAQDAFHCQAL